MNYGIIVLLLLLGCTGCSKKAQAQSSAEGQELFASACARCHGTEGRGGLPLWDNGPAPRNFHDHAFQQSKTDDELKQTIKSGKGGMPPFGPLFNDAQLAALVSQIRTFDDAK